MKRQADFQVSENEWQVIRTALAKWEPEIDLQSIPKEDQGKIREALLDNFILHVEEQCRFFLDYIKRMPPAKHYIELDKVLKHLNLCMEDLEKIASGEFFTARHYHVNEMNEEISEAKSVVRDQLCDHAGDALKPLRNIENLLKMLSKELETPLKTGRRTVDLGSSLIDKIAELYRKDLLAKPTTYPQGPFTQVVKAVLNILDLPTEDPSRQIRKAAKSLQS